MPNKNILLLGAGMVSDPLVEYFAKQPGGNVHVTVATRSQENGQRLARIGPNVQLVIADVQTDIHVIERLIEKADLCVSLLPYIYHATVAKICIQKGTNMLTSSYISPELQAMDEAAKSAGVTVMNECGLDPGIDHMLAMECIDAVHQAGGKVNSFVSFCGGLPAPEVSDNPLRYKFSWSPRGMLLALLNPAKYLLDGQIVEVEPNGAVLSRLYPIKFLPAFHFVGYPNRDSTKYAEIYGLGRGECQTLLRGTLRFQGFVEAIKAIRAVGYLSTEKCPFLGSQQKFTWRQVTAKLANAGEEMPVGELKTFLLAKMGGMEGAAEGILAMEQLGLMSDARCEGKETPLDTLAHHLAITLKYGPEERDLVVLNHDIQAQYPNGMIEEHRISLIAYGHDGGDRFSAMARTVGYTAAIVAEMLLNGEIKQKGMVRPVSKELYGPVLDKLAKQFGIKANTKITRKMAAKM